MAEEQNLQNKITRYLRGEGWLVVKTIVLSLAGFPDIFAFRNKVAIFIEVKSPKGKLTKLQQYRIDQLKGHGFYAEMFNDFNIFKKNYEQIPDLF
ncbi:MAG: VRR-NUC domain-containing protein [Paludibacteraceae bacterium]